MSITVCEDSDGFFFLTMILSFSPMYVHVCECHKIKPLRAIKSSEGYTLSSDVLKTS